MFLQLKHPFTLEIIGAMERSLRVLSSIGKEKTFASWHLLAPLSAAMPALPSASWIETWAAQKNFVRWEGFPVISLSLI